MYFIIRDEKNFDKYMTVWGKVNNIIKTNFNRELICNKKYLKAEKDSKEKKVFNVFIYQ